MSQHLDLLIASLRSAFANNDSPGRGPRLQVTEITAVMMRNLATPLYAVMFENESFPKTMSPEERSRYREYLRAIGIKHDRLVAVPWARPSKIDTLPDDVRQLINEQAWRTLVSQFGYDFSPVHAAAYPHLVDEYVWESPKHYDDASVSNPESAHHWLRSEFLFNLLSSYATMLVSPETGVSNGGQAEREQHLKWIEEFLSYFVRWPILGYAPDDDRTLYVLVA